MATWDHLCDPWVHTSATGALPVVPRSHPWVTPVHPWVTPGHTGAQREYGSGNPNVTYGHIWPPGTTCVTHGCTRVPPGACPWSPGHTHGSHPCTHGSHRVTQVHKEEYGSGNPNVTYGHIWPPGTTCVTHGCTRVPPGACPWSPGHTHGSHPCTHGSHRVTQVHKWSTAAVTLMSHMVTYGHLGPPV